MYHMSRPVSTESKFRALAHATRRGVIELLLRGERTAGDLAGHFSHSRPVLSKHLRVLEGAGLIVYQRHGAQLRYRLAPGAFDSVHQWIGKFPRTPASR